MNASSGMAERFAFADVFWDKDIKSSNGFDKVCNRMQKGYNTCKEVVAFLKDRAKCEENYANSLLKLQSTDNSIGETGSIKEATICTKKKMNNIAMVHSELSGKINEQIKNLKQFMDEQKSKRQEYEKKVTDAQKRKIKTYDDSRDAEKSFHQKVKETSMLQNEIETAERAGNTPEKKLEKMKQKLEKLQQEVKSKDSAYKNAVNVAERTRSEWEGVLENAFQVFQNLDEDRIKNLRNELWVFSNHCSITLVEESKLYEEIRGSLEQCSEEADIQEFIRNNGTGRDRPEKIFYKAPLEGDSESLLARTNSIRSDNGTNRSFNVYAYPGTSQYENVEAGDDFPVDDPDEFD